MMNVLSLLCSSCIFRIVTSMRDEAPGPSAGGRLLTPAEVGAIFRVDPKTAARWAAAGLMDSLKTPGGHWRFPESSVLRAARPASGPYPCTPADDNPEGDS
jgi:hypothetical protein